MSPNRRTFLGGLLTAPFAAAGCSGASRTSSATAATPSGSSSRPPAQPSSGSSGPSLSTAADWSAFEDYLGRQAGAGLFSGAVRVEQNGRPLLDRAFGTADRGRSIANAPDTRFCIASLGKMFTAVAIGQLVSAGKVAFDDTVGRHVPGFPPEIADHVTVAQLLTHTSGMGDALRRSGPTPPPDSLDGLLALIAKTPLLFPPGSSSSYSNSGFIVAGAIVEHVGGAPYAGYLRDHIFAPAGMADTDVRVYRPVDVPNMAHGYELVDAAGNPLTTPPAPGQNPIPPGASFRDIGGDVQIGNPSGGAISTTADVARFARALTAHQLLDPAMTATVTTGKVPIHRPGGPTQDSYAYGFEDQRTNGVRIIGHNGGTPGYEGQLDICPDLGTTVVILTNQDRALVPATHRAESVITGAPGPA